MPDTTISIPVDSQVAQAYNAADEQGKRRMQAAVNARLRELTAGNRQSLEQIMDEIGRKAQERGLTPEILDSILKGE